MGKKKAQKSSSFDLRQELATRFHNWEGELPKDQGIGAILFVYKEGKSMVTCGVVDNRVERATMARYLREMADEVEKGGKSDG